MRGRAGSHAVEGADFSSIYSSNAPEKTERREAEREGEEGDSALQN
jgi:hypothetical protein